jgi:hypothetical protein
MKKLAKSGEELTSIIRSRLSLYPAASSLKILIAPIPNASDGTPNWRIAFTTGNRRKVPTVAWQVANQVSAEFDLAQ